MEHLLLIGLSTRAAADSAARAGFDVTALDAFADLDQHPDVQAHALEPPGRRFTATAAARAAATLPGDAVAYLSPFENHPGAVQRLAAGRTLLGNPPDVLRRVRDPVLVADTFARHGFAVPRTVRHPEAATADRRWMLKPLASGGGTRISECLPADLPVEALAEAGASAKAGRGRRLTRRCYLQERIEGQAGSIAFVAAGGLAVSLGISRQLIGEPALGAAGTRYCGSIRLAPGDTFTDRTRSIASELAGCAARAFGLVGLNGVDFMVRDGVPLPIEINPRWSASMELADRLGAVFAAHAAACRHGTLPDPVSFELPYGAPAWGKAILFAADDLVAGDTRPWLTDDWRRDIPRPGTHIGAGQPICTVFAAGTDAEDCRGVLIARAAEAYRALC